MKLLIMHEPGRLCEGHHGDGDPAPLELAKMFLHLAEMRLAGQSGQVAQKNHQEIVAKLLGEIDGLALEIQQRQFF